jgi:phosphoribosylglycinamide formyltransferase-1
VSAGQPGRRLGILLSGRGSNFQAIAQQCVAGRLNAQIVVVISNRADAAGLEAARAMGIPSVVIPSQGVERVAHDRMVAEALDEAAVDYVILAGYMRILSAWFIQHYPQRILNIHPALLPAFPGLDAQHQAWEYGVRYAGCTVHFVDEKMDSGPIIDQAVVPVLESDRAEDVAARILAEEHRLYSEAIGKVLQGGWRVDGRRVLFER